MERKLSLTIEGIPLLIRKSFKEIPYYRNNSLTNEDMIRGNPYHVIEIHPLLYTEAPYCGRKSFLYYRRKPLTNKETIQGNPLL